MKKRVAIPHSTFHIPNCLSERACCSPAFKAGDSHDKAVYPAAVVERHVDLFWNFIGDKKF